MSDHHSHSIVSLAVSATSGDIVSASHQGLLLISSVGIVTADALSCSSCVLLLCIFHSHTISFITHTTLFHHTCGSKENIKHT